MGIHLDWEIESDASGVHTATEDPNVTRSRRGAQVRFLVTLLVIIAVIAGVIAVIEWRLHDADLRIENFLRDTVDAEIAALRISDWTSFANIQRSADSGWLDVRQRQYFDDVQTLKTEGRIQLTGAIRDLLIDGTRGRILVENIIDGIPYVNTWFYWRYEDGWRHVPPDFTFWGEIKQYNGTRITVVYQALDERFAYDLGVTVEGWVDGTCTLILQCGDFPHVTVNVIPDEFMTEPIWGTDNLWRMDVPSPYTTRARSDQPFTAEIKQTVAVLLTNRLIQETASVPSPESDAAFLRASVEAWLVGRFMALNPNTPLITSLGQNYGLDAIGKLFYAMTPTSSVNILVGVTGVSQLDQANLDWRDFLTWRLQQEDRLYRAGDLDAMLALYDPQLEAVARERFAIPADPNTIYQVEVTQVNKAAGSEGTPYLDATVAYKDADGNVVNSGRVIFRLIDNVWLRAN